jgi:hypothetical protein
MFGYLGSYLFDRELSKWYLGNCFMFVYGLVEQRPRQKFKTTNKQKTQNVNKCLPTVLLPKRICLESNSSRENFSIFWYYTYRMVISKFFSRHYFTRRIRSMGIYRSKSSYSEVVLIYLKPSPGTTFLQFRKMDKNMSDKS